MNAARGASALVGAVRMMYTVSRMSDKTRDDLHLSKEQAAWLVRLDHAKGNYTARDGNIRWFELVPYDIGNGKELGLPGDTIAVPKPWVSPNNATQQQHMTDRELQHRAKLQQVRDHVALVMPSEHHTLASLKKTIGQMLQVGETTAWNLLREAIPEGVDVIAVANGYSYVLSLDRRGSRPKPIFITKRLVNPQKEAMGDVADVRYSVEMALEI